MIKLKIVKAAIWPTANPTINKYSDFPISTMDLSSFFTALVEFLKHHDWHQTREKIWFCSIFPIHQAKQASLVFGWWWLTVAWIPVEPHSGVQSCTSAQCSRCQIGCSGSQNLPCSIYRRIRCSCSYCMEHPKILLYQLLEQFIHH